MNIKKLILVALLGMGASSCLAYKITLINETDGDIQVNIIFGGCKNKNISVPSKNEPMVVDIGLCCTKHIDITGLSGPVAKLKISNYTPKKGTVPLFGFRCGNYVVRVQQSTNTQGKIELSVSPQEKD